MSKRFGRNQKRKLKQALAETKNDNKWLSNRLDNVLFDLKNSVREEPEVFYVSHSTDLQHCKAPLHKLELETYLDNHYMRECIDMEQMVIRYKLCEQVVAYRYSEKLLKQMDEDSLKYYITQHMAEMLVDTLRGSV